MDNLAEDFSETIDETPEPEAPPRNKGGRPKGAMSRRVVQTRQEFLDPVDESGPGPSHDGFGGIFAAYGDEREIVKVRVKRVDPDEGMLGYIDDPACNLELTITERWGGGTFRLEGLNHKGRIGPGGYRTIKIAQDPIFVSTTAEQSWRRARGLPILTKGGDAPAAAAGHPAMSFTEIMQLQQAADDRRRAEEREHAALMRKVELDAEDKRRKDEDERRRLTRLEDEERDKRRAKDDEDRENRRRVAQAEADARQQQFTTQTIQMIQASSNQALELAKAGSKEVNPMSSLKETLAVIATVKDVFATGGSDGEPADPMTMLWSKLPEMVGNLASGVGSAIREIKTGGVQPAGAVAGSAPSALAMLPAGSPLAGKLEQLAMKIAAKGGDPELVLSQLADNVMTTLDGNSPQVKPAATAPVIPQVVNRKPQQTRAQSQGFKVEPPKYVSTAPRISFKKAS